jgi:hypothetical protein
MAAVTGDDGTPSGFAPGVPFGMWGDSGSSGAFFSGGNGVIASSKLSSGVAGFTLADSDRAAGAFGAGPRVGVAGAVTGSTTAPVGRVGVYGTGSNEQSLGGIGVQGESDTDAGVLGHSTTGAGVLGVSLQKVGVFGVSNDTGVLGLGGSRAGIFIGDVEVTGSLIKGGGGFRIDHPVDPANKYLRHSFVESSEMKNLYDGIVVCDADGGATIPVPEWFELLNSDFRYQLTPIGNPGPDLFISRELEDQQFELAGGTPGLKVSWQITGIRRDAWAKANPMAVEEAKSAANQGQYLHPEAHGQPPDHGITAPYDAEAQRRLARARPDDHA